MRCIFNRFVPAFSRLAAACIILFALSGCDPNNLISGREDDYSLGEAYIGSIILFANSTTAPDYFYACDGRYLSTSSYQALRAILGTAYGPEQTVGTDTKFALPLLEASISGTGYYICPNGTYPVRQSDSDPQLSNDYVGAISRFGGSYDPPGTYYSNGTVMKNVGQNERLAYTLGSEFQYNDYDNNLFRLPDLTAGITINVDADAVKKFYIAYYGVLPAMEYYDYSGSFFCGMIKLMAGNFIPLGWRICDGAELQVREFPLLYETMTYGSAQPSVKPKAFSLPNIPSPMQGTRYIINTAGAWPFYQIANYPL